MVTRMTLGDEMILGYNIMAFPLSSVMIMFYITTVRGFLLMLVYCVFTPIAWILTPINKWVQRIDVEEISSVKYENIRNSLNDPLQERECAVCLDYLTDSDD